MDEDEASSDTEDPAEEEDVFDSPTHPTVQRVNTEHSDPNSYSWLILKLATLRIVLARLTEFLTVC